MIRPIFLSTVLTGAFWLQFIQPLPVSALIMQGRDVFDRRPARSVLVIGNSRTYANDMPEMIRKMADSAGDYQKYQIVSQSFPGAHFSDHWKNATTRVLLRQTWDDIILQSESRAQSGPAFQQSFKLYGEQLIRNAKPKVGKPRLIINWPYDGEAWGDGGDPGGVGEAALGATIEQSAKALASQAGARTTDVKSVWRYVRISRPDIKLTSDGNHPTLAGSYLYALAIYTDLSAVDPKRVKFVPEGLEADIAADLREAVAYKRKTN
jgi:hypothetical protein